MTINQVEEVARCYRSPGYFLNHYGQIYDATSGDWLPFHLWPEQERTLEIIERNRLTVILKARQLGLTWLTLGYALWMMLFRPAATVLIFSKRDEEALYLLSDERLRGIYQRLPEHLTHGRTSLVDSGHEWMLSNGSVARAFPTTAGDSYTASLAIVDEADLAPDLNKLMRAVKPTIDGGGRMILLSRADKAEPQSEFKQIYRAAKAGGSPWTAVFLPWHARPERNEVWYDEQRRSYSTDDIHEQYPATDIEALAPKSKNKRISYEWLERCYDERRSGGAEEHGGPALPLLEVYRAPQAGRRYVIGVDTAEGNPGSDDSAFTVLDKDSGEEAASLAGKLEPAVLAAAVDTVGRWYNNAAVLVERNNHGHAVLLWLHDNSRLERLLGRDLKEGWLSTSLGKTTLYDGAAEAFRNGETTLHSFATFTQLASIEGATLRAPGGEHDDRADCYALALQARVAPGGGGVGFML